MGEALHLLTQSEFDRLIFSLNESIKTGFQDLKAMAQERPMSTKDAATFLSITPKALIKRVHANKDFPHYKVNGSFYFYPSQLNDYIKRHKRK